jgi:hypothetical protein
MRAAGIGDLKAVRDVSLDKLMHVRGIGRLLAVRIKEMVAEQEIEASGARTDEATSDLTDVQIRWQETVTEQQGAVMVLVGDLLAQPQRYGLKPKFMRELERLSAAVDGLPVSTPPIDSSRRTKILKHVRAIVTLLDSAEKMDEDSVTHRKVLKSKLRERRKKLAKWA